MESSDLNIYEMRKEQIAERLQKREEARLAELERKKANEEKVIQEQTAYFSNAFTKAKQDIEEKLSKVGTVEKCTLRSYFDSIAKDFQILQKFVADSTFFLPSYDIRIAHENLKSLQEVIQTTQDKYLPKKKFAFKSKKKHLDKEKDCTDCAKSKKELVAVNVDTCLYGFRDLINEKVTKEPEEINGKDIELYHLENCMVKIFGLPNTIHINGIVNCTILMGPVSTSVFIENCTDCTFVMACQQARIHSTTNTHFYLHVTTRAIIEDCKNLKFAPYNWHYPNIEHHFDLAGLDQDLNNWNNIDDFNWLVTGLPSPNWSELPEDERIIWK
ncbi:tubulin-specific chaperone C [Centruroides vittatus]|uniref:tubulin-specific chaperone C n=1 Tax=Centruroides vittatus TaxID=120091 RepID=UPI00350F8194